MDTSGEHTIPDTGPRPDDSKESTLYSLPPPLTDKVPQDGLTDDREPYDSEDKVSIKTHVEQWRLAEDLKDYELNDQAGGRRLGVTWKDLTVSVVPSDEMLQDNILSQFNLLQLIKDFRQKPALRTILDSSSGCVRPGEMLLVLGRPGSGCTTLLKLLANKRKG